MASYNQLAEPATLPGVLGKATSDPCWCYVIELRNGNVYATHGVDDLGGGWIHLHAYTGDYGTWHDLEPILHSRPLEVPERGLTIRLDEVRWAAEVRG